MKVVRTVGARGRKSKKTLGFQEPAPSEGEGDLKKPLRNCSHGFCSSLKEGWGLGGENAIFVGTGWVPSSRSWTIADLKPSQRKKNAA